VVCIRARLAHGSFRDAGVPIPRVARFWVLGISKRAFLVLLPWAGFSELAAKWNKKAIFGPKTAPKAARSEVLAGFRSKNRLSCPPFMAQGTPKLCFGGFGSIKKGGRESPFWDQNRPKGVPKGVLGDFAPKKVPKPL